ncbi:MAG: hypothetical protein PHQ91_00905 [Thermoanaerobaculaceae bacterium]|nr:hypothetical protein [Thermoanaerobaculaceae bacterium]TAM51672.1 MAG: hypothetical protein EPN53_06715 [Acidobacteriota bacterium]
MEAGELVVVSCSGPKEKFWGVLLALTPAGVTLRGVRLDAFEEWLRQRAGSGPAVVGPTTVFFPAHRIDRIELDESTGPVEGLADRFRRVARHDPRAALLASAAADATGEP